jgi:hypothetical protein
VPGIIEDGDPGRSGLHMHSSVTVGAESGGDVPTLDVESFSDRLRLMGLDTDLVDEADRRLRSDPSEGMHWLEQGLKERQPPRKPPTCSCGDVLIDVSWRGRATVRCGACGSRWGVEVVDEETESLWAISGPTPEWVEAHPIEERFRYDEFQPANVLRDGMPPIPADGIEPGTFFPVATWQGTRDAAVLYVHRLEPDEFDLPGDEYEEEIEHLVLGEDGQWTGTGSGGGNWVNVFDPPADLLEKYVVLGTGISGTGDGDDVVSCMGALCSSSVGAVEAIDKYGSHTIPVSPERPFFVVGVRGPGQVRILDKHGRVLTGHTGVPLEFDLNG